jgi:DNA-binding beta-propeller fold protein YncE
MKTTTIAGRTWHYSHYLGRQTAEHNESKFGRTGGYCYPMDVAVAADDVLFVISRGMGYLAGTHGADIYMRIGKTSIDEDHFGDFARREFTWPAGIAVAHDGNVYCSDEYDNRITVFDPEGILAFPEFAPDGEGLDRWGVKGSAEGQLNGPSGLVFDGRDDLYVVDSLNNRVQKFAKGGEFIMAWGRPGSGEGEFDRPWGISIDAEGAVYVADWGNHRVQKFSPDGEYLMSFGGANGGAGALSHPAGVAVDSDGDVYVTDWGNRRVQIFEPIGEVLTALYGDATKLSRAGEYQLARDPESIKILNRNQDVMPYLAGFGRPIGIAIDPQDRIIISDARSRLQVYKKDKGYEEPPV